MNLCNIDLIPGSHGRTDGLVRKKAEWRKSMPGGALDDVTVMSNIAFDHFLAADKNVVSSSFKRSVQYLTLTTMD